MSGPKVVRIVTREELIEICEGHLARVDAALAEWNRIGKRNDCVSEAEIAAGRDRREALARLIEKGHFDQLQKQAPQEAGFLYEDMQSRLAKVAAAAAAARSAERRQGDAATALLAALAKAGRPIPGEIEGALRAVAAGAPDSAAISAAFALLSKPSEVDGAAQNALAARHGEGLERARYADWLAGQPAGAPDPVLATLDRRLAELQLAAPDRVLGFEARLRAAEVEIGARRDLLLDSLSMDLGQVVGEVRTEAAVASRLGLALAELALVDPERQRAIAQRAEAAGNMSALEALLSEAGTALTEARTRRAALLRRAAVLESLAGLGYEVTEGMATGWVDNGQLVLRNAARPGYGMEIGGDLSTARVQMRAVAFADGAASVDRARDIDAETLWCDDLAAISRALDEAGGGLMIEKASAIGATPLKRVADPAGVDRHSAREGPAIQTRTLR